MAKFWGSVAILIFIGLVLLAQGSGDSEIDFRDLETECRYDSDEHADINLRDGRLFFQGNFPVDNPDSELSYSYNRRMGEIVLDVRASGADSPEIFWNDCLGSAVYDARTGEIPDGFYKVTLRHDGSVYDRRYISIQ